MKALADFTAAGLGQRVIYGQVGKCQFHLQISRLAADPGRMAPRKVRESPFFGQAVKLGLPDEKDGPDDGQAEAVWG